MEANAMDKREQILSLFQMCHCEYAFCDECPNRDEGIIECYRLFRFVNKMCLDLINENAALMADMQKMAETRSDCVVCDHYTQIGNKPGCELNGWHCEWRWRGIEKFKNDTAGV